jgi:Leucine-rich repeat (LRR) protein
MSILKNSLKKLDISYTNIGVFPEVIRSLTQLESLNIANSKITVLTDALGDLLLLEELHVAPNQISYPPPEVDLTTFSFSNVT